MRMFRSIPQYSTSIVLAVCSRFVVNSMLMLFLFNGPIPRAALAEKPTLNVFLLAGQSTAYKSVASPTSPSNLDQRFDFSRMEPQSIERTDCAAHPPNAPARLFVPVWRNSAVLDTSTLRRPTRDPVNESSLEK